MKKCSVEGCTNKHLAKGYCDKHYRQWKKHGYIPERNKKTPNEIVEYHDLDCAEIVLYNQYQEEIARALIDLDDIDLVKSHKWCLCHDYVITTIKNKNLSLHRFLMNPLDDMVIDHINHNKLDNRRKNLRMCTSQQNHWNIRYKGEGVRKSSNKYVARITCNNEEIYIGRFDTKDEAVKAYREKSIELFGEFSPYWDDDNSRY